MDIAGVFGIFDGVNVRNIGEVFILGRGGHIHPAEFFGLLRGLAGELARYKIIGLAGGHQVHGHHGELCGRAALNEAHLIIIRNTEHAAQSGLGLLDDGVVHRTAVALLHHALAG